MEGESRRRDLIVSAGKLAIGIYGSSAIGLVSLAITARSLTPAEFGSLVLIIAYVALVEQIVSFQSWQAYVKFGSAALAEKSDARLRAITRYCVVMEASSLVVGAFLGVALAFLLSAWIDWLGEYKGWAAAYSLTILARFTGISTGILRLERAFGAQAATTFATGVIRLVCVFGASLLGTGLDAFILAWLICEVIAGISLTIVAAVLFRRRQERNTANAKLSATPLPEAEGRISVNARLSVNDRREIRAFMWSTNLEGAIRAIRGGDIPIIGTVLGPEGAGLYAIARRIAGMLLLLVETSVQAIYPDLASAVAKGKVKDLRPIMVYASVLFGGIALLSVGAFAIFGEWIVRVVLAPAYQAAVTPTSLCLIGAVVWGFMHPLWPALLALSKTKFLSVAQLFSSVAHVSLTYVLAEVWELNGAAMAFVALQIIWSAWLWFGYQSARKSLESS
jgi:O-antigen/teichoic acid export membrane protein